VVLVDSSDDGRDELTFSVKERAAQQ
jgi:hypothetical protein